MSSPLYRLRLALSTRRSLNPESHPGSMEMNKGERAGAVETLALYYITAIVSLDFSVDASKDV